MATARRAATRQLALTATALLLLAGGGRAERPSRLIVDRAEGAEQCPDEAALAERVQRIRERTDLGKATYRVAFSRSDVGLAVSITAEPSGRARTLTSGDVTCDAIANAAAVTLALLFDAEPTEPPASPATPTTSRVPPKKTNPEPHVTKQSVNATLSASVTALAGVTGPIAFGGTVEAGVVTTRFRTTVGTLWTAPVESSLSPGNVREGFAGGVVRGCFAPVTGAWRLDACTGAIVGLTTARSHGYSRDETRERPWLALPAEIAGSFSAGHFAVELGASALFPVVRHDFGIDGLGVPYRSNAVGAMVSLRLIALLPL